MKTPVQAFLSFVALLGLAAGSAFAADTPAPPKAEKRPFTVSSPHGGRTDEYYWLRDDTRKNPAMLAYLAAENAYREAVLAPTKPAQETLYTEMVARLKQDDASVPFRKNGWWYYSRFTEGKEYPIYARKRGTLDAPEEIMLDVNALAAGQSYIQIAGQAVTLDGRLLAWTQDTVGRRQYSLRFKDLVTGTVLTDRVENIEAGIAWTNDNRTLLYVEKDPVTLLGVRVRKHVLGTDPKADPVVYEEKDNTYYLSVTRSRSDRFLAIYLRGTVSSEARVADAADPTLAFRVLIPREREHEYQAEDHGDRWVIRTNWQAKNFRVVEAPADRVAERTAWRDVVPHRPDAFVHGFAVFRDHLAVTERSGGLRKIRIKAWGDGAEHVVGADEPTYTTFLDNNPEVDTAVLRYSYTSLTTPLTIYDYDLAARSRTLRKREPVLGRFDPADYASEYLRARARDGKLVPVSLVYRKGFRRDGTAALYLHSYGSYGSSTDPIFSGQNLSLLDRGVVIALAHIRGGQELGRAWYEDGKLLKKKNTFTDFIDVTDFLVREGYAAKDRVAAEGGSAGGLLMGAIANLAGEKYRTIIAHVPWVDVVTGMLDASIPLTTNEYDEWGNPADKAYYEYMLSYSPYDNVTARAYPALYVTGALWDSQVQYFDPAKWVARLRDRKTDAHPLLLRMNMAASHGGKSGRFQRYRDTAEEFAFLFTQWGIPVAPVAAAPLTAHEPTSPKAAKRPMELADLFRVHRLSDPQVSPDGRNIVYVVTDVLMEENRTQSDLWLVPLEGGTPRQLTSSPKNDSHPRWSPDGKWIAFESDRDGRSQIWLLPVDGGEAHKLTAISTGATQPVWSPDGKALAFVSAVFPEFSAKPFPESDKLNQEKRDAREKSKVKARVITALLYRHWDSWVDGLRQHLFVVPVGPNGRAADDPRDVTPGENDAVPTSDTFVSGDEFAFSPDGRELVFTAPPLPVREQAWSTNHDLWSVNLTTGVRRQFTTNLAADGCPRFSPDGRWLAYRAQRRAGYESDRWELMLLDRATGAVRSLTAGFDRWVAGIVWSPDSSRLFYSAPDRGMVPVWTVTLDGTEPTKVVASGTNVEIAAAPDGRTLAFVQGRLTQPAEIMRVRLGDAVPQPVTRANAELLKVLELTAPEFVTVAGAGGTPVQMWIVKPPKFDPAKKYPLVFLVHGGPQGAWGDGWSYRWNPQLWVAQGYVLALPNPRGSTGFGQQFTDEISRDWGGKVFDDLMACLAHLDRQPYIDATRMAAAGGSYGGYMMNWFEGHTDRFKTLVTHCGIYNFSAMYGATEEIWFTEWDFGLPWETSDFDRFSPHRYAAKFKTPNLIIHGELDFRVPIGEAMSLFTTLQRRGVPSKLLVFPDEGHLVNKPQNSELWHRTVFEWLAEYLKKE